MRMPELPVEPVAVDDRRYTEAPEDEDRIHKLVQRMDERTDCHGLRPRNDRNKPQFVGPSAELMPGGDGDG